MADDLTAEQRARHRQARRVADIERVLESRGIGVAVVDEPRIRDGYLIEVGRAAVRAGQDAFLVADKLAVLDNERGRVVALIADPRTIAAIRTWNRSPLECQAVHRQARVGPNNCFQVRRRDRLGTKTASGG